MPVAAATGNDLAESGAAEVDARLIRAVRWRLVAWSGGSTLLVLLVLGLALYFSVASSLEAEGVATLDQRALDIRAFPRPGDDPDSPIDVVFGGGGTLAIIVTPNGTAIGPRGIGVPQGMPDLAASAAAATSGRDVRLASIAIQLPGPARRAVTVPVRQLTHRSARARPASTSRSCRIGPRRFGRSTASCSSCSWAGSWSCSSRWASAGCTPAARWFRSAIPSPRSAPPSGTSASSRPTRATSCARHSRSFVPPSSTSGATLIGPSAEVGDALGDIDAEVGQLTSLVEDLLLLARSDSGAVALERVPLHLDDVAAEAAAALAQPAADAGVRVEVDPQPAAAVGDPARLRQLVMILVDNAIRHSPRGSAVRVVVRSGPDAATVAVEDAGPGVRSEDRERVFDRFWRAPGAPAGGTGLGLAIAKWITEHHQGSINVDASPAGGARFEVRLPARSSPEEVSA